MFNCSLGDNADPRWATPIPLGSWEYLGFCWSPDEFVLRLEQLLGSPSELQFLCPLFWCT